MLAAAEITNLQPGDRWDRARIGVTQREVYVVPREKGRRSRSQRGIGRPRFGEMLQDRAWQPALEENTDNIVRAFDRMLDRVAERINAA